MFLYRIANSEARSKDLSGTGAYRYGGRWNNKGTYMLYTSENSSLAYLEMLVHFDPSDLPSELYILRLRIPDEYPQLVLPDADYPDGWLQLANPACKKAGDQWMAKKDFLAIKVRSAINYTEFNYLLNPQFPAYTGLVEIISVNKLKTDERLLR